MERNTKAIFVSYLLLLCLSGTCTTPDLHAKDWHDIFVPEPKWFELLYPNVLCDVGLYGTGGVHAAARRLVTDLAPAPSMANDAAAAPDLAGKFYLLPVVLIWYTFVELDVCSFLEQTM